jgi:glycosyltransferase involved in cell wall biosynthesis
VKIVARVHAYPPGCNAGAEWMLHSVLRPLAERGHHVEVVLTRPTRDGSVYRLDGIIVIPASAGVDEEREVRSADVVITHLEAAPHTIRLAEVFDRPLVQVLHNDFAETTRREIRGRSALLVSNTLWLRASLGLDEDPRVIVVRPPVFAEDYRTTPGDKVTMVNLTDIKGPDVFWALASQMSDVDFLAVRGAYGDQRIYPVENVEVRLNTSEMRSVYGDTKILLMPSRYDSFGRVAVEAMCSGIPVIATDDEWSRESICDAGFLLPRTDIAAWRGTIRTLLDDPAAYEAASKRARARADELDPAADIAAFCAAVEALA